MKNIDIVVTLMHDLDTLSLRGVKDWETGVQMAQELIALKRSLVKKEEGGENDAENRSE